MEISLALKLLFVCLQFFWALSQGYADAGTVKQNYVNILLMLLRLRQACDHPLLVKGYDSSSIWRSSVETAKKIPRDKQIGLLNCLESCLALCTLCNVRSYAFHSGKQYINPLFV